MRTIVKYLLLSVAFAFIASGSVEAAFADSYDKCGAGIYWLLVPMVAMFMLAAVVDIRFAVPRYLLRQRYSTYGVFILMLSYVGCLFLLIMEYLMRLWLDVPMRITNYLSPWIPVESLTNSIMLSMILLGIGALQLYKRWNRELECESRLAENLREYMAAVKSRLDSVKILGMLDEIGVALKEVPSSAASQIRNLAQYLRHQLYELPSPPEMAASVKPTDTYSSLTEFMVSKHYRLSRHLIFQLMLLLIAFGTFFNAPDQPEFSMRRVYAAGGLYLFLNLLAYTNILWLFRRFKKHHNLRRYCISVVVVVLICVIPMIVVQVATYDPAPYNNDVLPVSIMIVGTIGSIFTLTFFIVGTGAILFLQDWIIGTRRLALLRTETVRQEYAFLRKQINPHFLFNVLNNMGILADEDPGQSSEMLIQLKTLLHYQFSESDRGCATVGQEVWFLRSYLNLEKARIEPFDFSITTDRRIGEMLVPTLIFITFVENAVKYSTVVAGSRYVNLTFERAPHGMCLFRCVNSFSPQRSGEGVHSGGLGLANTRRRLAFLYGERFSLSESVESDEYIVTLTIPTYIDYEMSDSR